jgi:photosystem II stability/assembly factor-like uncharacterized protein
VILDRSDDSTSGYQPWALSCSSRNCTAIVSADFRGFEFLRSDDAGETWRPQFRLQNYGVPYFGFNYVNALQQIDSANAVVVGDSGRILRTYNAGITWERQSWPSPFAAPTLRDVHFSDPENGIVTLADRVITTSDGGRTWVMGPTLGIGTGACHCFGAGHFAVLRELNWKIYSTTDNWETIDSTSPVMDTAAHNPALRWAKWSGSDTVFACGLDKNGGLIVRSIDAGATWRKMNTPKGEIIMSMSEITDDTIVAGRGDYAYNRILVSTDRGVTWTSDTVPVQHQGALFPTDVIRSVARPMPGVVLAATQQIPNGVGQLIRGTIAQAAVPQDHWVATSSASPNPASDRVTLWFSSKPQPVNVLDVLGRTVLSLGGASGGAIDLDVSALPAGTYFASKGIERIRFVKR